MSGTGANEGRRHGERGGGITALPAPRYYCMACPAVFYDAATSNKHHDDTGHNQHWKEEMRYKAPAAPKAEP